MSQQYLRMEIQAAQEMGFSQDIIERATKQMTKGENLIELCLEIQAKQNQSQSTMKNLGPSPQLNSRRTESYTDAIDYDQDYNLTDRIRKKNVPVGLMNVGNTCYFNSLIQSYFNNSEFCKYILKYRYPSSLNFNKLSKYLGDQKSKRVIASINLVVHLQRLFSFMILSDKKFFNPTNVLKNIVNSYGERLKIGDQQDIGEFNLTFLSRVEEGLIYAENNVTKLEDKWLDSQHSMSSSTMDTQPNQEESEEDKRIKSLFFGKRSQISNFHQDGKEISHTESQEFSQIYLLLECKDLYTAWEEQRMYTVDDFKNDQNETVTAFMQLWISKIPEVLLFQIQRMQYDQKTQEVIKLHSEFNFDKEIYIDRFLEVNKEMYFQIQNKLQEYKKQVSQFRIQSIESKIFSVITKKEELNQQLEYYQNFDSSHLGIEQILSMVQKFYTDQQEKNNGDQQISSQERENVIRILELGKQSSKEKISSLQSQLQKIKEEEDLLFQSMKKQKYVLQSVLIHKGSHAEFGHYFSYIFDINQQKWFKYDDINCSEVEEQEVLKNSRGFGDQSAYGLIYVNEDLIQKNKETIYKQESTNLIQYIPTNLKDEIIKENKQFQLDLEEYNMSQQVTLILREYEKRFTFVEIYIKKLMKMQQIDKKFPCLLNFGGFLYHSNQLALFQYHILDTALKASISPQYNLHELLKDTSLLAKLKDGIRNLYQNRSFLLQYSSKEIQLIDMRFSEFIQNIKCSQICYIILDQAINQDWENSLVGIHKLIKLNQPEHPYFRQFGDYILAQILLKLSCLIFDFCGQDTPQNIFKIISLIVGFSKLLPKSQEILLKQMKLILQDFTKNAEILFDKPTLKSFNDLVKGISDQSKNDQYASIVQKPHQIIDQKIEEIQRDMDKQYFWNMNLNEDKYLNQLFNTQKQFDQQFKRTFTFYNYINDKQTILPLKERLSNSLHADLLKK